MALKRKKNYSPSSKVFKKIYLPYHSEPKIHMSEVCERWKREQCVPESGRAWGAVGLSAGRWGGTTSSPVQVRQICHAHLSFWGCLFSRPLPRTLSGGKFILCCSPAIALVNWVNINSRFIIYNFCPSVKGRWWPNHRDTLALTAWQTGWNCWHKQLVYFVLTLKKMQYETLYVFKIGILTCVWQITSLREVQNLWFSLKFNYLALSNSSLSATDM